MEPLELKNVKLLYIEDDTNIRCNAVEYLSYYCNHVFEAEDGEDGYEKYLQNKPDIIISDIQMPKLNGLDMIEKIRKKDKTTQIIITTAHLKTEYLLRAIELQLVKYLEKPLYEAELIGALKMALSFMQTKQSSTLILDKEYSYDLLNRSLFYKEAFVKLNSKELQLLDICAKNRKRVVTYSELNNQIWEGEMSEYALSSLVKDLRKKLPRGVLENVSGVGYRLKTL